MRAELCKCSRRWPVQNKKRANCKGCEWEYKNPGLSYEDHLRSQQQATADRMRDKQLLKLNTATKAGAPAKVYVSTYGAGSENLEPDESYLKHLDQKAKQKPKPIAKISKRGAQQILKDEETYTEVWERRSSDCCENCGAYIGSELRDERGRIADKFRFSHILSKGAYIEFRNNVLNFNLLCFNCHQLWEVGDEIGRKAMRIYAKNMITIAELFRVKLEQEAQQLARFED